MKLLFPIETSNRELLPKLFLACKFAEKEYISFIGNKANIKSIIPYIASPVYFDKGYHKGLSEEIYNKIEQQNGIIISLDEENGVDLKNFTTLSHRFPENVFDYFDLIFLWGQKQYNFLKKNRKKFPGKKIIVSGHPRFELLKSKYRIIYDEQVNKIHEKYGKYILINTSFGLGNNILGDKFAIQNYKSRFPNVEDIISYEKKQMAYFIDLVKILYKEIDLNIILRPHPEENQFIYSQAFNDMRSVIVEYEDSVIPWILGCEVMIHHSCTTALEATMLGKIPISYIKDLNNDLVPWIPLEISQCFSHEIDIIDYIRKEKYKNKVIDSETILTDYFSYFNNTTDLMIEKCDPLLKSKKEYNTKLDFKLSQHLFNLKLKTGIKKFLFSLNLLKENPLGAQKRKGMNRKNIQILIEKLKDNGLVNKHIKISTLNSNLYKISK